MNYIKLINAFYDRLETNSLSTSAIALWHALVHVNNKAGWQREFTVAVSVLCVKTGLSERTITNARNDLKIKGYLDFKSRKGSKSAVYWLFDLSANIADRITDKKELSEINADNVSCNTSDNVSCNTSDNVSALIKQKETKLNETKKEEEIEATAMNPYNFFEENGFGTIGAHISQKISTWCKDLSDDLVVEAMKIAVERGVTNFSYVERILQDWTLKKISNVTQARALILAFKQKQNQQKKPSRYGSTPKRTEKLPDWFNETSEQKQDVLPKQDTEEKMLLLQKRLEKYKNPGNDGAIQDVFNQ
jgi:DnaD/phage-associated family protein